RSCVRQSKLRLHRTGARDLLEIRGTSLFTRSLPLEPRPCPTVEHWITGRMEALTGQRRLVAQDGAGLEAHAEQHGFVLTGIDPQSHDAAAAEAERFACARDRHDLPIDGHTRGIKR